MPTQIPPRITRVIDMVVPRVDADGNEVGGVPAGFHKDQLRNYAGGMIPFARTKAEREAGGAPRPSLEERHGTHAGYVKAVEALACPRRRSS